MRRSSLPRVLPAVAVLLIAGSVALRAQSVILSETTRVTLTSSMHPVPAGQPFTLTASVTTPQGGAVPGGTVQFIDEMTLNVLGRAEAARPSIEVRGLPPGRHAIRAEYSGTDAFLPLVVQPSQSAALELMVQAVPQLVLASSRNPSRSGEVVTLTAKVSAPGAIPTGTVTFRACDAVIAAGVTLDGAGLASFITSALPEGDCPINVAYHGDAIHAPATSALDQSVAPFMGDTSLLSRGM
uniref:Bacterial Ig-like domain-containing protein n=1 Tax=Rhodopseudomonas palustris (strain BisA53) TaxID=316055 RepID=Q07RB1_RHOP5